MLRHLNEKAPVDSSSFYSTLMAKGCDQQELIELLKKIDKEVMVRYTQKEKEDSEDMCIISQIFLL